MTKPNWGKIYKEVKQTTKKILITALMAASIILMGRAWLGERDGRMEAEKQRAVLQVQVQQLQSHLIDLQAEGERLQIPREPLSQATVYGYSSTPDQTDSSPFITASGIHVREGIVANNCQPFGTKVQLGGKTYDVQDRMNSRYGCDNFDIWHSTREAALNFGVKELSYKVI